MYWKSLVMLICALGVPSREIFLLAVTDFIELQVVSDQETIADIAYVESS